MKPPHPQHLPLASRRHWLGLGAAGLAAAALAPRRAAALALPARASTRSLAFENLHTGETLRTVYWEQGRYLEQPLRDIEHLLRDFRTGDVHPIDVGLLDLLCTLRERSACSAPIQLISGYRSPLTNAGLRSHSHGVARASLHMQGMAADIRLPGRALGELHQLALTLGAGGVGYYPRSNFVHVDVGPVRRWSGT